LDHVSHPYITTCFNIVLYILISDILFTVLGLRAYKRFRRV
jgi:hypothetical protein